MTAQIAGGLCITFIQESANELCPTTTLAHRTFKDMGLPLFDVLNQWEGLKEHIDQ